MFKKSEEEIIKCSRLEAKQEEEAMTLKKIGHAKATAEVLQIFNELMESNHQTTNSESMAPQDFGRSV